MRRTKLTDQKNGDEAWFYALGGRRIGPIPSDKLHELLEEEIIDGDSSDISGKLHRPFVRTM
jgi:hypothetical protein